jgi:hypothetical protein
VCTEYKIPNLILTFTMNLSIYQTISVDVPTVQGSVPWTPS